MKKKILLALAAMGMAAFLSGCGGGGGGSTVGSLPASKPRTETAATMTVKYGDRTAYFYEYKDLDLKDSRNEFGSMVKTGDHLYFVSRYPENGKSSFGLYEVKIEKETAKDLKKIAEVSKVNPVYSDGKQIYFSQKIQENGKNKNILSYYDGKDVKFGPDLKDSGERKRWLAKEGYLYELAGYDGEVNLVKSENGKFTKEGETLIPTADLTKASTAFSISGDAQGIYISGLLKKDGKQVKDENNRGTCALSIFDTKGKYQRTISPGYLTGASSAVSDHFIIFSNEYYKKNNGQREYEYAVYNKSNGAELGRFILDFHGETMVGADGDSVYILGNKKLYRVDL